MIEKLGYQADIVSNGQQALDAVRQRGYSIVFMDCQMPLMDGFEATVRIRTEEGSTRHTPIIAMTANAMTADRERCLAAGMDDYLAKPVALPELQRILSRWLPSEARTSSPPVISLQHALAVDPDMMKELRELDGSGQVLVTLIDHFVEETPARLTALKQAVAAGHLDEVKRLAHFLNGSAKNLGAWRMQVLCEDLEMLVATGHLTGGECLAVELENTFHETRRQLMIERGPAVGAGEGTTHDEGEDSGRGR
jgi:CheY-like chemotaxis protein/HPt (histidine-containing phosphotransfer) domain-containing protein